MSYIIASEEGDYDKYISLSEVLEVICCLSEYTAFYATNYLEHHNFLDKIQAYYIDSNSGKISPIHNAKEIIMELFQYIREIAPTSNITRDLPNELGSSLCDINFIDDELNNLELLQKFGDHHFTNELDINSSVYKLYQNEKDVVIEMLNEFALKQLEINSELIPVNQIPELIGRFFHNFIICNDELRLISTTEFMKYESLLEPKTVNTKLHLIKKPTVNCDQQLIQELAEAQAKITELETELAQVKAKLDEQQQAPQRTRAQTDETNTDKKLIAMLAILLAKQSNAFRIGDRPNATQINEQVLNLTMQIVDELGMNENDTLGLKANTDKISKAVQAYADMFKLSKD